MNTITIPKPLFQNLILLSFRYSIGRRTGIGAECVEYLTEYWEKLPQWIQKQIHFDIKHAIECDDIRPLYNINEWKKILELKIND